MLQKSELRPKVHLNIAVTAAMFNICQIYALNLRGMRYEQKAHSREVEF
jgi:hypothetical protein